MPDTTLTVRERLEGAVLGLLVGDALGVPYEFHPPAEIPPEHLIELDPPSGFRRAHHGVQPGTWSDDGAHALCLLASLLERGRVDPEDLMQRLARWYDHGYFAVDGRVFDVGIQTSSAIRAYRNGTAAILCGGTGDMANGNGSLMRVLPLALWHTGSDAELTEDACLQSRVTHGHRRSQLCCALYSLWARRVLAQHPDPFLGAVRTLRELIGADRESVAELDFHIRPTERGAVNGTGYVVDCLRSARHALEQPGYEKVVRAAIRLGNDTDTTACVAGGLAGLREGVAAIPSRWLDRLRDRAIVEPLLGALVQRRT